MPDTTRQLATGLRKMADLLESIGERRFYSSATIHVCYGSATPEEIAAFIRDIKALGSFEKRFTDSDFEARVDCGGGATLVLYTNRAAVCTKRTVTKEVTVDEWDCDSILEKALAAEGVTE